MSTRPRPWQRTLARATATLTLAAGLVAVASGPGTVAPAAADPVRTPRATGDDGDLGFTSSLSGESMNGYRLYELPIDSLRNINAINDDGQVAGWKYTAGEDVPIPFVWTPGYGVQELDHNPTKRWWV